MPQVSADTYVAVPPDVARTLAESQPALAGPARLFIHLLPRLFEEPACEPPPALSRGQASAKLAAGLPLLRGEALLLDGPAFRRRWGQVCAAVRQERRDDAGRQLAEAVRSCRLQPDEMLRAVLDGRPEEVFARPKTGFYIPLVEWMRPEAARWSRAEQSRHLALAVLAEQGVSLK